MPSITGLRELDAALAALGRRVHVAAQKEMRASGERLMEEKVVPLVPVDTTSLLNSRKVEGDGDEVVLSLGGPSTPHNVDYAKPVHENYDANFVVGQANFLGQPIAEAKRDGTVVKDVGEAVAKVLS